MFRRFRRRRARGRPESFPCDRRIAVSGFGMNRRQRRARASRKRRAENRIRGGPPRTRRPRLNPIARSPLRPERKAPAISRPRARKPNRSAGHAGGPHQFRSLETRRPPRRSDIRRRLSRAAKRISRSAARAIPVRRASPRLRPRHARAHDCHIPKCVGNGHAAFAPVGSHTNSIRQGQQSCMRAPFIWARAAKSANSRIVQAARTLIGPS